MRRGRTTSSKIVRRLKILSRIVPSSYEIVEAHDHHATLIYKEMLAFHHAIIMKSYVIVLLWYDYRSTVVRCRTIYL